MMGTCFGGRRNAKLLLNHSVARRKYRGIKRHLINFACPIIFKIFGYPINVGQRKGLKRLMGEICSVENRGRALDVGCGIGYCTFEMGKSFGEVVGIDIDSEDIGVAQQIADNNSIKNVLFMTRDAFDLDEIGTFDSILASCVLEHIKDDVRFVSYLLSKLNPSGNLFIVVPKRDEMIEFEHQKAKVTGETEGGHYRDGYTSEALEETVCNAGGIVKSYRIDNSIVMNVVNNEGVFNF